MSEADTDKTKQPDTPVEDKAKVDQQEDKVVNIGGEAGVFNKEAAKYRTERNAALKEAAGLRAICEANGLETDDLSSLVDLSDLTIKDGQAIGRVTVSTPVKTPKGKDNTKTASGGTGMTPTLEEVAKWDTKRINDNWEMVEGLLRSQKS